MLDLRSNSAEYFFFLLCFFFVFSFHRCCRFKCLVWGNSDLMWHQDQDQDQTSSNLVLKIHKLKLVTFLDLAEGKNHHLINLVLLWGNSFTTPSSCRLPFPLSPLMGSDSFLKVSCLFLNPRCRHFWELSSTRMTRWDPYLCLQSCGVLSNSGNLRDNSCNPWHFNLFWQGLVDTSLSFPRSSYLSLSLSLSLSVLSFLFFTL